MVCSAFEEGVFAALEPFFAVAFFVVVVVFADSVFGLFADEAFVVFAGFGFSVLVVGAALEVATFVAETLVFLASAFTAVFVACFF